MKMIGVGDRRRKRKDLVDEHDGQGPKRENEREGVEGIEEREGKGNEIGRHGKGEGHSW